MTNRAKGEAGIEVDGQSFVLAYNVNAMCEIEYVLAMSTDAILTSLTRSPALHIVRALLWGGLRQHHPDLTLAAAGELMEKMGGSGPALEKIGEGLVSAFPDPPKEGKAARPRKGARAGIGTRS